MPSQVHIDRLWWELLTPARTQFDERTDLFDRADADAVGPVQGPVDRAGFRHTHFGAADQETLVSDPVATPGLLTNRFKIIPLKRSLVLLLL
jgi:hypothetical protein